MADAEERHPRASSREDFPWPSLFQRSTDPLYLLNRSQRLLFVNRAWEEWAGLTLAQVRGLRCRTTPGSRSERSWERILATVLAPPREVRDGHQSLVRRFVPAHEASPARWWEIDFLPLRAANGALGTLGHIRAVGEEPLLRTVPLPEALVTLRARHRQRWQFDHFDSRLPAMRRVVAQARLAAPLDRPVLLVGPPGVGKETLARLIHAHSPRCEQPLAALDCRKLPAFAVGVVLFRSPAPLGAIYLHDPAALPREVQAQIAQELTGDRAEVALPRLFVGCPAAPNDQLVEEFYEAVNLLRIDIPPLSARRDDLPRLVNRLLQRLNADGMTTTTGLTPDAWEVVLAHTWPGNLTELYRVLQSARRHSSGEQIDGKDLPFPLRQSVNLQNVPPTRPPRLLELDKILEQVERRLIELALTRAKGNQTRAAEYLSIWRPRLIRRMKALQLGGADTLEAEAEEG